MLSLLKYVFLPYAFLSAKSIANNSSLPARLALLKHKEKYNSHSSSYPPLPALIGFSGAASLWSGCGVASIQQGMLSCLIVSYSDGCCRAGRAARFAEN